MEHLTIEIHYLFQKKTKKELLHIVYQSEVPLHIPSMNMTSTKIQFIISVLQWSELVESKDIETNEYLLALKTQMEYLDVGGLLEYMENLQTWLKYRNEVMHASMNKNVESLYENLASKVEEGMEIARFIDNQIHIIKRRNSVRKIMQMQNN